MLQTAGHQHEQNLQEMILETNYQKITDKIHALDPIRYGYTRNYLNGAISYLSPYISRGVISTKKVLDILLERGFESKSIEKFIQELSWRDYWQQLWKAHTTQIDEDFRQPQPLGRHQGMPLAMLHHTIGIEALDDGIKNLYQNGYLHNHLRMYLASVACNVGQYHWKIPAQWMYYHLLDADWASNALSWQWVAGANSKKLYYANQENINQYTGSQQKNTFLDVEYHDFAALPVPEILKEGLIPELKTPFPTTALPSLDPQLPILVYNFYHLDPLWHQETRANRVLLLEPSIFEKYPVSKKSIDFCIALAQENIPGIKVWVAEFSELQKLTSQPIYFREHPLNQYSGIEEPRELLTPVQGSYPSFFTFWKKSKKHLGI